MTTARALICRTVHTDPDRRWVAHIASALEDRPGRIAQRPDDGTGHREYAPTWEAALAAAHAHLAPEPRIEAACGYCHHPGTEPCEEPSSGPELCTRAEGHEPPHVACSDHQHGQVMWATTVETTIDPLPQAQRFAEQLNRALGNRRPLGRRLRPDIPYHASIDQNGRVWHADPNLDPHRPGLAFDPAYFAEQPDTAEERHLKKALDAALDRVRDLEQQQHTSLEVAEELAGQLEKVEQERDRLTTTLATTARQRDEADKRGAELEQQRDEYRDAWQATEQAVLDERKGRHEAEELARDRLGMITELGRTLETARPVKPTDKMVERGMAHIEEKPWTVRSLLTAALTEEQP